MNENDQIKRRIKFGIYLWLFLLFELALFFYLAFDVIVDETLSISNNQTHIVILYLSYIISVAAVPGVFKLYDMKKKKLKKNADEKERSENYFFAKLIQFAVLETAGVLLLLSFYLNETYEPLYFFGIIYVTVLFTKPSYKQYENDFLIDREGFEEEIVYMPDEVIRTESDKEKDADDISEE